MFNKKLKFPYYEKVKKNNKSFVKKVQKFWADVFTDKLKCIKHFFKITKK